MYSLRAGGAALACPHARRRLAELSEAQLHEVCCALAEIPPQHCPSMDTDRSGAPGRCMERFTWIKPHKRLDRSSQTHPR